MTIDLFSKSSGSFLVLGLVLVLPVSVIAETELEYSYSDEWSVVSAPPPTGPYRSVHIDPRVPGQGITQPVTATLDAEGQPDQVAAPATDGIDEKTADIHEKQQVLPTVEVTQDQTGDAEPENLPLAVAESGAGAAIDNSGDELQMPTTAVVSPPAEDIPTDSSVVSPATDAGTGMAVAAPAEEPLQSTVTAIEAPQPDNITTPQVQMQDSDPVVSETVLLPPQTTPAPLPDPDRYGSVIPPVAGTESQPVPPPSMSGPYGHMMPPAAGGIYPRSATPHAAQPPVPGQYGRMMPPPPGFNYPVPAWQSGRQGMPGYMNMPPFGYYRGPVNRQGGEVPPPAVYLGRPPYGGNMYPAY